MQAMLVNPITVIQISIFGFRDFFGYDFFVEDSGKISSDREEE